MVDKANKTTINNQTDKQTKTNQVQDKSQLGKSNQAPFNKSNQTQSKPKAQGK